MKKEFNKEKYFKMINKIMTEVRKQEIPYARIYSEPRIRTGYRTKLWICSHVNEVKEICERLYPGKFDVTYNPEKKIRLSSNYWYISIKPKTK